MSRDALVVGISTYTHLPTLKAPAADAEAISQRLERDGEFRVRRLPEAIDQSGEVNRPVVGKTTPVTRSQLKKALEDLFKPAGEQIPDTALFYFSGHGLPSKDEFYKGFLATSDTDPTDPEASLSFGWLKNLLAKSPVKQQIVWLDCCHSGALLVQVHDADPGDRGQGRDRCFIASSRDYQSSWQDLNSPYSVLTKALLAGLDPQRLIDRWITNIALTDFINQALQGELQSPVCNNSGEPIHLTRTWRVEEKATPVTVPDSSICPYKGLEYFDCNDEDPKYFFGREALTDLLLDRVRQSNFLALVGASGSGKSSVLRAGLLHHLKLGRKVSGSDRWQIRLMRPDDKPLQNLALAFVDEQLTDLDRAEALGRAEGLLQAGATGLRRLVQASPAPRTLLVIDQFEEVFTLCQKPAEREQFFATVLGALPETEGRLCVILAMRADFVGKCLEQDYSGLAKQVEQQLVSVIPLNRQELETAICRPAQLVGLEVEPVLVQQMLEDIDQAPGSLPLLQYTLTELWQHRQANGLQLHTYQTLGGIKGTLAQRATQVYDTAFTPAEQATVRHIFLALTQLGEGTEDTRRRVLQPNLVSPKHPPATITKVVQTLANAKLIVTSEVVQKDSPTRTAVVDVAHEALIRHWPLLRRWLDTNRDLLRQQRRIEAAAETWQERHQAKGYLLQGLPLDEASQFQQQQAQDFPLSTLAHNFIRQGLRQRWQNRLKTASWLIIPATILIGIGEFYLRETQVRQNYARLDSASPYEERQAVQDLVKGCSWHRQVEWLPSYLAERLFGTCRSLQNAPLSNADLRNANLNNANLSNADLSNADLSNAYLSNAYLFDNLFDAYLRNATLINAYLSYADLSNAYLSNADLRNATLSNVTLINADLINATLSYADLINADLRNATLSSASLRNADLSNADLRNANLSNATLSNATLSNANLSNANLSDANLSNANLIDAYLGDANLIDAYLSDANLIDANLSDANLRNANLRNANLRNADLSEAILLKADLSTAQALKPAQLAGKGPPLLCATQLPPGLALDPNRDCQRLPQVLVQRYPREFKNLEAAKQYVQEALQEK